MTLYSVLMLYIAFRAKQFFCDFVLQNNWMAKTKGRPGLEGYKALFSHCLIHALGTLLITLVFAPSLWWLGVVDFLVHSLVDRLKGVITYKRGWQYTDKWFWWIFGLDQEAHNITHMVYLLVIVAHTGIVT